MKSLLKESYKMTKSMTGLDARNPHQFRQLIASPKGYETYMNSLTEGLTGETLEGFKVLAENTRVQLMENSMFQLNPYETLVFPVLRNFWPRLIAKELVTVRPIDKPEIILGYIKTKFKKNGESTYGHEFPSTSTDISRGPGIGVNTSLEITAGTTDLLNTLTLTSSQAHIEKDIVINEILDSTGGVTAVNYQPTVDGVFSIPVTHDNGDTDTVSGRVDFLNGTITWASTTSNTSKIGVTCYVSLEENTINPMAKFELDKIRLTAVDRRLSTEWSINIEQDVKALYDINLQSDLVNVMGEQIALDIDSEIISAIISANTNLNPASHKDTFNTIPPDTFTFGKKNWYENILVKLNRLSAQIYNTVYLGGGNTIACNPVDASIFESLDAFEYTGDAVVGGTGAYRMGTLQGGKWRILTSAIVPQGTMPIVFKSDEVAKVVYIYAPYVPCVLMPFPLGNNPTLTIQTRYATRLVRSGGIAALTISDTKASSQ